MSLGRSWSVSLIGLDGAMVDVEAQVTPGLPAFRIVGLPDVSLTEARDRVRAAVQSCHLTWPMQRVTVGLTPAERPKHGSAFDLAIAVSVLRATGLIEGGAGHVLLGELGLDGRVHPVRGVLPAVAAAVAAGHRQIIVPQANLQEAELVTGARVSGVSHLAQVVARYGGDVTVPEIASDPTVAMAPALAPAGDLSDVVGQAEARMALEVAAAGGHHLLMTGPPGTGKTMLAARLPGLLPDLTEEQAVQVTALHSVAGTFDASAGLMRRPPFESPHHTATVASLVGGGSGMPRPGAASRAHLGVLLLDECPEFSPRVLDSLRQPLEHGELVIHRARGAARYPARFQLVLAANPCPCGRGSGKGVQCTCTPLARRRYLARLSGPLLDRIDIRVEVPNVTRASAAEPAESTGEVAARVQAARQAQARRLAATPWSTNGEASGPWVRSLTRAASPGLLTMLEQHLERGRLSLRGLDRVLRLAWTLADLHGAEHPGTEEAGTALVLRSGGSHG